MLTDQSVLLGFVRLRFNEHAGKGGVFEELTGAALIRELHVYGVIVPTYEDLADAQRPQVSVFVIFVLVKQAN